MAPPRRFSREANRNLTPVTFCYHSEMEDVNKAIPASYIFLEKDGKILVSRRFNTGFQDGNYQVPAGHVDKGEVPSEAVIRETKEEVGVDLSPEDIELVHISYRPKHDNTNNRVDFFFRAYKWKGEPKNMEPDKCDDVKWVPLNDLPENMSAHVRDAIESTQKGIFFRELGFPFLKEHGYYML